MSERDEKYMHEINRLEGERDCYKRRLAEAEARYKALLTTVHGAHELLSVIVDDLAEAAQGG